MKKLIFEVTNYRDWTMIYCFISIDIWITEFKKQFGWSYTDVLIYWDGKKEAIYRASEEHKRGMFNFILKRISNDRNFIKKTSESLIAEVKEYEKLIKNILSLNFSKFSNEQILKFFNAYCNKSVVTGPKFLIMLYFPQQLESFPEFSNKYSKEKNVCIKTRTRVEKIFGPMADKAASKFADIAINKINLKSSLVKFLTPQEVRVIISGDIKKSWKVELLKNLKQRSKKFLLSKEGKIFNTSVERYIKKKSWSLNVIENIKNIKTINGTVAFRSNKLIRGYVVRVDNKSEITKVNKNDILVAPMTIPEYLPAIKKVKAIVTDEGGITCHAAIVSRELKKPCIIGTKIATRILKDGDFIEVDAEKGVVNIINQDKNIN